MPLVDLKSCAIETSASSSRIWFWLLGFVVFGFLYSPAFAQSKLDLLAVDSSFMSAQYEKTELLALRILQSNTDLTPDEQARLNLTMGYAAIMLGRENDARSYFAHALDAVPDLELDPVQVSPKFRVVFDDVKAVRKAQRAREDAQLSESRLTRVAMLSNLIIPGSGQWQQGRPWRGALAFGLQAVTVGALIYEAGKARESREDYIAETDRSLVQNDYDRYNRDYQRAWMAGAAAGLVYLAAQADLIWLKPAPKTALRVALVPSPAGAALAVCW